MLIKLATQENKISLFQHFLLFSNYTEGYVSYCVTINFAHETDTAHPTFLKSGTAGINPGAC